MPVVGVIENMSGFTTEEGRHYPIFGSGGGSELADQLGVPLLGQIPLDPTVVNGGDEGRPVVTEDPDSPAGASIRAVAAHLVELIPPAAEDTCTARIAVLAEQLATM